MTPSLFATGDCLDLLDLDATPEMVASALHARMCTDGECGMAEAMEHALRAYLPTARAMHVWHVSLREAPAPPDSYLALCACGHLLRGHSIDRKRCYTPACSCMVEGGFRPAPG